jgi:hypothetical protein
MVPPNRNKTCPRSIDLVPSRLIYCILTDAIILEIGDRTLPRLCILGPGTAVLCARKRIALLIVSIFAGLFLSIGASAQDEKSPPSTLPSASQQSNPKILSEQEREDFRLKMSKVPLPSKGCFIAHYPNATWQPVTCGTAPKYPNPVARGARPTFVGNGNDYFIQVTGNISSATGSFDSVTGVKTEYGARYGDESTVYPNTYTLQLNANQFSTSACGGVPGCMGWEQFVFSQSVCTPNPTPCIFIEYWLLYHPSPCPAGWIFYAGTPGCFINTAFAAVPMPPLAQLQNLKLTGSVSGGIDTVTLSTASGDIVATAQDSILGLAAGWTGGEFNLVGDCCLSEAYFNSGSNLTVRLSASNGTTSAPTYTTSFSGATGETNNLNLTGPPSAIGGASPAIVFSESGGGLVPPGVSIGDTHLTTFQGVHYDLQASGDFLLVQSDPDFVVQARQAPWVVQPAVSVNTAVGIKMGKTSVAVCLTGLDVNGGHAQLDDGKSLSLFGAVTVSRRGNIYTISRPSGDIVQAEVLGNYINVSVTLGVTNPGNVRGLLGGREGGLTMKDGTVLGRTISWDAWRQYADSWRVPTTESLLCHDGLVPPGMPSRPISVEDLKPPEREHAQAVCLRAGVKQGPLLNDCILDVGVLGVDSAADVFVFAPPVKTVAKPMPPP